MKVTVHQQSRLHNGIYRSDRESVASRDMALPLGPRNLRRLVRRNRRRASDLCASYGGIGAGESIVFVTTDDGQRYNICDSDVLETPGAVCVIDRIMEQIKKVAAQPN